MLHEDPAHFEIDVDLAPLLGNSDPVVVSSRWYSLLRPSAERPESLQRKIERTFRNAVLREEWLARRERIERRRAVRVPLLTRVQVSSGARLVATDISVSGLRCSGRPRSGVLDIEFKLPTQAFPLAARAEVVSFRDSPVIPLVGLRFLDIERPYVDEIFRYIETRSRHLYAA